MQITVGFKMSIPLSPIFGTAYNYVTVSPSVTLSDDPKPKADGSIETQHELFSRLHADAEMYFRKELNAQVALSKAAFDAFCARTAA